MRSVILEAGCFTALIASAVEVYSKETTGMLIGKRDRRFIRGKLTDCVVVQGAYPLQTARKGFGTVMIDNLKAFRRVRRTINYLGFEFIGEYHSHPGSYARLTMVDEEYIRDSIKEINSKVEMKLLDKQWLELIVGIVKKKYKRQQKMGWYPRKRKLRQRTKKIRGTLKTKPRTGYDIEILGYWIDLKKITPTEVYYSSY
ncbi:MAG: Mov34/MPN/PAD-1 family protein [Thermoplasmata archaeon]|nr:Mov34/MPN/PAD-1 family protein [Thermoplasmata archaeon]